VRREEAQEMDLLRAKTLRRVKERQSGATDFAV
jgi:hypothetical protein